MVWSLTRDGDKQQRVAVADTVQRFQTGCRNPGTNFSAETLQPCFLTLETLEAESEAGLGKKPGRRMQRRATKARRSHPEPAKK